MFNIKTDLLQAITALREGFVAGLKAGAKANPFLFLPAVMYDVSQGETVAESTQPIVDVIQANKEAMIEAVEIAHKDADIHEYYYQLFAGEYGYSGCTNFYDDYMDRDKARELCLRGATRQLTEADLTLLKDITNGLIQKATSTIITPITEPINKVVEKAKDVKETVETIVETVKEGGGILINLKWIVIAILVIIALIVIIPIFIEIRK